MHRGMDRSLHFVISRSPREGELFGRGDGSCTFQCALAHCPPNAFELVSGHHILMSDGENVQ